MANSIAKLAILLTTDASGVSKGFAQAKAQITSAAGSFSAMNLAGLSLVGTMSSIVAWSVKLNEETHTAAINFRVMLGSAEAAQSMLGQLKQFAIESPFGQGDLQANAQTMLAFGMEAKDVIGTLRMLGDVSLGNSEKMSRLTLAFAQASAAGKLTGQDLLQMVNAGFNPLQEISRVTGIEMSVLRQEMEKGAITTEMLTAAFQSATQEGGRFNNAMKESQDTIRGQFNMLKETVGEKLKPLTDRLWFEMKEGLRGFNILLGGTPPKIENIGKAAASAGDELKKMTAHLTAKDGLPEVAEQFKTFASESKSMASEAKALTESMRTPGEKFAADAERLNDMLRNGSITGETFARAMAKAREELQDANKNAKEMQEALRPGTAATSRFSMQGRSDVLGFERNFLEQNKITREQVEQQRIANRFLEKIKDVLEDQQPVEIEEHPL